MGFFRAPKLGSRGVWYPAQSCFIGPSIWTRKRAQRGELHGWEEIYSRLKSAEEWLGTCSLNCQPQGWHSWSSGTHTALYYSLFFKWKLWQLLVLLFLLLCQRSIYHYLQRYPLFTEALQQLRQLVSYFLILPIRGGLIHRHCLCSRDSVINSLQGFTELSLTEREG